MKTYLRLLIIACLTTISVFAQTPQAFKYQAVVRDAVGTIISNQAVGFQLSIVQGSAVGPSVYTETQLVITNNYGLANMEIGNGTLVSGDFMLIDWSNDNFWISVEMDPTGGTSYAFMGSSQLLSVPYALNAGNSFSGDYTNLINAPTNLSSFTNDIGYITSPNDADADPTNELNTGASLAGTVLSITDAGGSQTVDLVSLQGSVGTDDQNIFGSALVGTDLTIAIENGTSETIDLSSLQDGTGTDDQNISGSALVGTDLTIAIENGFSETIDLSSLQDGTGTDDQNISGSTLVGTDLTIAIENGSSETIDLSSIQDGVVDADADTTNELNTGASLSGTVLSISDAGGAQTVDLASLLGAAGTDDQNISGSSLSGTDLVIGIENGTSETIDLSSLQDGTGTDDQNISGSALVGTDLTIAIENGSSETIDLSSIQDGVVDADADTTNELNTGASLSGTVLSISDAGGAQTVDLASLLGAAGTDDQNISGSSLSGTDLVIGIENGTSETIDLSSLQDGTGTDDQNISGSTLVGTDLTIAIENGSSETIDLSSLQDGFNDDDADSTNELQTLSLLGNDLTISDGNTVDISGIGSDNDWTVSGNDQYSAVSGNVGIGTSSPNTKLSVVDNSATSSQFSILSDNTPDLIRGTINNSAGGGGMSYGVVNNFPTYGDTNEVFIRASGNSTGLNILSNSLTDAHTSFFNGTGATGMPTMYLSPNNNVGIGTTTPSGKLHVHQSGAKGLDFTRDAYTETMEVRMSSNVSLLEGLLFETVSNSRLMWLGADGKVGIGTISPSTKLHVEESNAGTNQDLLRIKNAGQTVGTSVGLLLSTEDESGNNLSTRLLTETIDVTSGIGEADFVIQTTMNGTGPFERFRIQGVSGNVGIGTNMPSSKLHVQGTFKLEDGTEAAGAVLTSDASGNATWQAPTGGADSDWIVSGSNQYSSVSGNVGIGTGTPGYKLDVRASGGVARFGDGTGFTGVNLDGSDDDATDFQFSSNGEARWTWRVQTSETGGDSGSNMILVNRDDSGIPIGAPTIQFRRSNGYVGINVGTPSAQLTCNGTANKPGGGSWAVFSDARLKKNINNYTDGLSTLMKFNTKTFQYNGKAGITDTETEYVGIVAQDVKKIAPYMIREINYDDIQTGKSDTYLEFDPSSLDFMIINAIQELNNKVIDLEKENAMLKQLLKNK